jgi:hypothetical protein
VVLLLFCYINKKTAQSRAPCGIPAACRQHDLYDSIEKGDYPRRNLDVRVMP